MSQHEATVDGGSEGFRDVRGATQEHNRAPLCTIDDDGYRGGAVVGTHGASRDKTSISKTRAWGVGLAWSVM